MAFVWGMFEIIGRSTVLRRAAEVAALRNDVAALRGELERTRTDLRGARRAADEARASGQLAQDRVAALETLPPAVGRAGEDGPPPVGRALIGIADRLVDLADDGAPTSPEQTAAALRWLRSRITAMLTSCDITPVADDGVVDFMRHEVVGDRPAPAPELVDHIAATVRLGYRWHGDLLRAQQVIAYVPAPDTEDPEV